jgi:RIO kinase 1
MKTPKRLQSLVDEGLIESVVRQLMSGKEATVYVVRCGDDVRCAKDYKEATQRSFRQAVGYTENRKVKNTRQARVMAKGTRFGRQAQEAAWQSAEVDALYRLAAAGVRVPRPQRIGFPNALFPCPWHPEHGRTRHPTHLNRSLESAAIC